MHPKEFQTFREKLTAERSEILTQANQEYGADDNKFENFELLAMLMRLNPRLKEILPEDVGWIFRLKHIIAQIKNVSIREGMEGRIIDDLNYGELIAGMREERLAAPKIEPLFNGENTSGY